MKRILITLLLLFSTAAPAVGALTYGADYYNNALGGVDVARDPIYLNMNEVEDMVDGTTGFAGGVYLVPQSAAATAQEGQMYYDSDDDTFRGYANGSFVNLGAGAGAPAGGDTLIQYNDGGSAFGAITNFIWDDTNIIVLDDQDFAFGTGADWLGQYDEAVDNQMLWITANTSATATTDPMFEILVGTTPTADQQVFGIGKGTQASNTALFTVDEDGDGEFAGSLTVSGSFYQAAIASAAAGNVALTINASGNSNITIGGISTGATIVAGDADLNGSTTDIGDAASDTLTITSKIDADVTIDDDTTNSPALILRDAGENDWQFVKVNAATGNLTATSDSATSDFQIVTGNLKVGAGSETLTLNGGDGYITGTFEVDGAVQLDGVTTHTDGVIHTFGNDEEVLINATGTGYSADAAFLQIVGAAQDSQTYMLRLRATPNADADNDFIVCEDNGGDDLFRVINGGSVVSTLDAAANHSLDAASTINTSTAGVLNMDVTSATANNRAIYIDYELDDGGSATQYGVYIDLDDDGAGGDETFHAVSILNSAGTNASTIGVNIATEIDIGINAVVGAASEALSIDAASTAQTNTTGTIDLDFATATTTAPAMRMDVQSDVAGGAAELVMGLQIQLDDNANTATDILEAIHIDTDDNATGLQHAIVVKDSAGWDAGLFLEGGYLRVGTGGTPDVALGDGDNGYFEGTLEIDGATRLDGAVTINNTVTGDGTDALGGFLKTVTDDGEPHSILVTESGTVLTNAGSDGADAWTLPTAVAGYEYTLVVMAAQELRITPAAGDVINIDGTAGDAAEYWTANAVGESLTLVAVDGTNWIATSFTGTWTQQTP